MSSNMSGNMGAQGMSNQGMGHPGMGNPGMGQMNMGERLGHDWYIVSNH